MVRFLFFIFLSSSLLAQEVSMTILHWNDFHSQNLPFQVRSRNRSTNSDTAYLVGGSATLASYIQKHHRGDSVTLVLNAGDDFQGSPISTITKGSSQIQLLNLLKPDALTLGNHEFDYGYQSLTEVMKSAQFPIVSANLVHTKSPESYVKKYIIKSVGTIRVAVVGLMTTELPTLSLPKNIDGLKVQSLSETINALVPELRSQGADIIVALTHQGVTEDSLLAVLSPDIDVIVGGHSHTPLFRPKYVNGILIAQAGSRGRWLGKIDLTIDVQRDTVVRSSSDLIECRTADILPDPIVAAKVNELEQLADTEMNEVIAELNTDWKRSSRGESNIGNWISDAMRSYAKTDVAFQNSGGIRKEVLAGNLTVRDFWEISPFSNTLVTFSVDGRMLRSMLAHQVSVNGDLCQISGLSYVYVVKNGARSLHTVKIGAKPLDEKKTYSIVTNNYVAAQSKKYFGVELSESQIVPMNVIDRDILIEAAKAQKTITSVIDNRIKEAEE
ncbi:MAG: bifunctional metallophosphatase/5'-nucleotidase [Bacteroidota bacterium]